MVFLCYGLLAILLLVSQTPSVSAGGHRSGHVGTERQQGRALKGESSLNTSHGLGRQRRLKYSKGMGRMMLPSKKTVSPMPSSSPSISPTFSPSASPTTSPSDRPTIAPIGAVYTSTNQNDSNDLVVYARDKATGEISLSGSFPTGGVGRNVGFGPLDPLVSQDPLIVTRSQTCVLVVNAGSNSISSFRVNAPLTDATDVSFVGQYNTTGFIPTSITEGRGITENQIYVLNVGENGRINQYDLNPVSCVANLVVPPEPLATAFSAIKFQNTGLVENELPNPFAAPGDLEVSPDGTRLYLVLKSMNNVPATVGTGRLYTYDLTVGLPTSGLDFFFVVPFTQEPFSMVFNEDGQILLTSGNGLSGGNGPGSVSVITPNPELNPDFFGSSDLFRGTFITGIPFTCWIRYSAVNDGCTYVSNAFTGDSISGFRSQGAGLQLITNPDPVAVVSSPLDVNFSPDEKFLYLLSTGVTNDAPDQVPIIFAYRVAADTCTLTEVDSNGDGLPSVSESGSGLDGGGVVGIAVI